MIMADEPAGNFSATITVPGAGSQRVYGNTKRDCQNQRLAFTMANPTAVVDIDCSRGGGGIVSSPQTISMTQPVVVDEIVIDTEGM